jgi:phage repressor protein C with HTH and peptisase S24 domain
LVDAVHISHITHNSDVRQSHFRVSCDFGTMSRMDADELIEKLKASGLTQAKIGAAIGKDRTAVTRLFKGERQLQVREIKILSDLLQAHSNPIVAADSTRDFAGAVPPTNVRFAEGVPSALDQAHLWPRDFPVVGTALGADLQFEDEGRPLLIEQTEIMVADTIDFIKRPPALAGTKRAYALYVIGSSMEPRFDPGTLVYVDPRRPPSINDDVVVQLRDGNGHDGDDRVVCALLKRLIRRSANYIELAQYNPNLTFKVPMTQVSEIHRVVPFSEIIGT